MAAVTPCTGCGEGLLGPGATEPRIKRRLAGVVPGEGLRVVLLRKNLRGAIMKSTFVQGMALAGLVAEKVL